MMSIKVTAIVPAHNEEKTIKHVLSTIKKVPEISEIICVDDGSTDKTYSVVKNIPGISTIRVKPNKGKGNALAEGIQKAHGEIILFLDADLTKLSTKHIYKLLNPVLKDGYEVVMGFPMEFITDPLFINVTGQRCYWRKDLIPLTPDMKNSRYGVEILLNNKLKKLKTKNVPLLNLGHLMKPQKRQGKELINELLDWTKEVSIQFLKQKGLDKDKSILDNVRKIVDFQQAIDFTNKFKDIEVFQTLNEYILTAQRLIRNRKIEENAKILWKYLKLNHKLVPSDCIIVFSNKDLRIAEYAATLFKMELSDKILLIGETREKQGKKSSVDMYLDIMKKMQIPAKAVATIKSGNKSNEKIQDLRKELFGKGLNIKSAIVIHLPFTERNNLLLFKKYWPELEIHMASPGIKFENYFTDEENMEEIINIMVGNILEIKTSTKVEKKNIQKVPPKVWEAYGILLEHGYSKYT